jgi:hypothetical protein
MKIKKTLFLYICLSGILLSGCVTLDLRQANHELINLYRAKSEAVNGKHWEQEVTVNAALSILADQAAEKCDDKTISQINRISFCRIAATAAWQAGSIDAVKYAAAGTSLCDKNKNFSEVPRDCSMFLAIPNLASVDELTKRYNKINRRVADGSKPLTKAEVDKLRKDIKSLFKDINSRIRSLLKNRDKIIKRNVHPKLIESLDKYIGTILCRHLQDTLGLIVQYEGVGSDAHRKAQCEEYKLKVSLKKLGFSQQIAPCLPLGDPTKPQGCQ